MKNCYFLMTLIACLLANSACHTNHIPTVSTYSFANPFAVSITMDVYGNKEDYSQNSNRIARYSIAPGAKVLIPFPVMESYWIDWYSADYSWNNWANQRVDANDEGPFPLPMIKIATEDDAFTLSSPQRDTSRSIILAGDNTASYWKMGITDDTTLHGYYELVFRKGFEGTLTLKKTSSGTSLTQDFIFKTIRLGNQDKVDHFDLALEDKQDNSNCGLVMWQPAGGNRDTLILVRYTQGTPSQIGYYPLLRQ